MCKKLADFGINIYSNNDCSLEFHNWKPFGNVKRQKSFVFKVCVGCSWICHSLVTWPVDSDKIIHYKMMCIIGPPGSFLSSIRHAMRSLVIVSWKTVTFHLHPTHISWAWKVYCAFICILPVFKSVFLSMISLKNAGGDSRLLAKV